MANLTINTGVQEYVINDKVKIYLNPTDPAFLKRLFERFSELEGKDRAWRQKLQGITDATEILAAYDEGDAMFRAAIDDVLGDGVCAAILGPVSVLAFADGTPIWMNILLAVIDEMDGAVAREEKAKNPKIQKYLAKYHR